MILVSIHFPPCIFHHAEKDLRVVVLGDDMTCLGDEYNLEWLTEELKKRYELKARASALKPKMITIHLHLQHSMLLDPLLLVQVIDHYAIQV